MERSPGLSPAKVKQMEDVLGAGVGAQLDRSPGLRARPGRAADGIMTSYGGGLESEAEVFGARQVGDGSDPDVDDTASKARASPPPSRARLSSLVIGHDDEDLSLVRRKELYAWLSYEWAAAPFGASVLMAYLAPYVTNLAEASADDDGMVYVLFLPVHYKSYYQYCSSLSVVCQLVFYILLSGVSDYGHNRRNLLIAFSFLSAIGCLMLSCVVTEVWQAAGIIAIVTNVLYGSSFVMFNAYLPVLVRSHPSIVRASTLGFSCGVDTDDDGDVEEGKLEQAAKAQRTLADVPVFVDDDFFDGDKEKGAEIPGAAKAPAGLSAVDVIADRGAEMLGTTDDEPAVNVLHVDMTPPEGGRLQDEPPTEDEEGSISEDSGNDGVGNKAAKGPRSKRGRTKVTTEDVAVETGKGGVKRRHPLAPKESVALWDVQREIEAKLSTYAVVVAFCGAFVMHIITLFIFLILGTNPMLAFRVNFIIVAVWWLLGMLPLMYLRPRPGPPSPPRAWLHGFTRSRKTLSHWRRLPQTFLFLAAFFLYSDGYTTVANGASMFATEEIKMPLIYLAILQLVVQLSALAGSLIFLKLSKIIGPQTVVLINMVGLGFAPAYSVLALTTTWECFVVALIYAFNIGSIVSFTRAIYSAIIPPGREAEFFSFYAITDRGTSWLGPLVLGVVNQVTGSFRWGFFSIIIFFLVGGPLLYMVDIHKAREQALAFDKERRPVGKSKAESQ